MKIEKEIIVFYRYKNKSGKWKENSRRMYLFTDYTKTPSKRLMYETKILLQKQLRNNDIFVYDIFFL